MTSTGCAAFAASMRVIDGVHGYTANFGTFAEPARTTGLADVYILMVNVTNLSNSRVAILQNQAYLAGGKLDLRILALFGHELCKCTCTPGKLSTFSDLELNVVDNCTERDCAKR